MLKTGKIETSIHHDWLGAHKTERERETERGGVHNKSE